MLSREPFSPSTTETAHLLDLLADPAESLLSITARFNTTLSELNLFLSRPEIAEQFSSLESTFAQRTRFVATANLPAVAASALQILNEFNSSSENSPSSCPRETALRAARIMLRLANFAAGPVTMRPSVARPARTHETTIPRNPESPVSLDLSPGFSQQPLAIIPVPLTPAPATQAPIANAKQLDASSTNPPAPLSAETATLDAADDSFLPELPPDDSLTEEQTLLLAADLIRKGAFSQSQIDEAFRLAAAEMQAERGDSEPSSETTVRHAVREFLACIPP